MYKLKEKELIISSVIGDGCIYKHNGSYTFHIGHGPSQKDYLQWKIDLLNSNNIFKKELVLKSKMVDDKKRKTEYLQHYCRITDKRLEELYLLFGNGAKTLTPELMNGLKSDRSLAIWFMDDGSVFKRKRKHKDGSIYYNKPTLKLCTHCFSYDEQLIIQNWFKRKYLLESKIEHETKRGITYYYIRFNSEESLKIFNLISPYIIQIPSMVNKFNFFFEYYN